MSVAKLIMLTLSACSHISYQADQAGTTTVTGFEIGTTRALTGFKLSRLADGSRVLSIDALNSDQVEGLSQINQGLSLIVEGAVKGVK